MHITLDYGNLIGNM